MRRNNKWKNHRRSNHKACEQDPCNNDGIISFPELIGAILSVPRFKKQIIKIEPIPELIEHLSLQ
jgi:hypothetical protein